MIRVEIEGKGKVAEFPDGTSREIIDQVIQRDFFSRQSTEPKQEGKLTLLPNKKSEMPPTLTIEGEPAISELLPIPEARLLRQKYIREGKIKPSDFTEYMQAQGMHEPEEVFKTVLGALPFKIPEAFKILKMARSIRSAKEAEKLRPVGDILTTVPQTMKEASEGVVDILEKMPKIRPDYIVGPYGQVIQVPKPTGAPYIKTSTLPKTRPSESWIEGSTPKKIGIEGMPEGRKVRAPEGGRIGEPPSTPINTPIIKTQLPHSQVTPGEFPETRVKPIGEVTPKVMESGGGELTKHEIDVLKQETRVAYQIKKPTLQKMKELPLKTSMEVHSPYNVFGKEPTGNGWRFWMFSEKQDRTGNLFLKKMVDEFGKKVKYTPDSLSDFKVGQWLDSFEKWKDIPDSLKDNIGNEIGKLTATKEEKAAFNYLREKFSEMGDSLVAKGYMEPTRKIRAYLFRVFEKDKLYDGWKSELPILKGEIEGKLQDELLNLKKLIRQDPGNVAMRQKQDALEGMVKEFSGKGDISIANFSFKKELESDIQKWHKLNAAIDGYEKTGTILYEYIPKTLSADFLKQRKGMPGYALSSIGAYKPYLSRFTKKMFDEPVAKLYYELAPKMPDLFKEYAHNYTRRYLGIKDDWFLGDVERALTMGEYMKDIGFFNTRSPLVNAFQALNQVIDLGPKSLYYMSKAVNFARTPEGKQLWAQSGHALEVPELRYGFMSKITSKAIDIPFIFFDKVEKGLRRLAYTSGYLKGIDMGMSPAEAMLLGDKINRRTNFLYGRVGTPLFISHPGGKLLGQYKTFSIKQLEIMTDWFKKDKVKLVSYIIVSGLINHGLNEMGIDVRNALGVGFDERELYQAFRHLMKEENTAAWVHAKQTFISGGGIFPTWGVAVFDTLKNAYNQEWQRVIPPQVDRVYTQLRGWARGEVTTEKGKTGYPVIPFGKKTLSHVETPLQFGTRLFFRPQIEAEEYGKMRHSWVLNEMQNKKQEKVGELYFEGKFEEANKLAEKYGWPSSQKMEAIRKGRGMTRGERAEERIGPRRRQFRERIGEGEGR